MDYILTLFSNGEFFLCKKILKTFQNGILFNRRKPEVDISDSFCVTGFEKHWTGNMRSSHINQTTNYSTYHVLKMFRFGMVYL